MRISTKNITVVASLLATTLSGFMYGPLFAQTKIDVTPSAVATTGTAQIFECKNFQDTVDQLLQDLNYKGLFEFTTQEIQNNPDNATAFYYRAMSNYGMEKEWSVIQDDLNKAISLRPQYVDALMARAFVFDCTDNAESAIADYSTVLSVDPNNVDAVYARLSDFGYLGNFKAALADSNILVQLNPDDPYTYYWRAMIHRELQDTTSAIADLQKASDLLVAMNFQDEADQMLEIIAEIKGDEGGVS